MSTESQPKVGDSDDSMDDSEDEEEEKKKKKAAATTKLPLSKPVGQQQQGPSETAVYFTERAKYIPLRLDLKERKSLRLLEAALNVSEYTDKVDILSYSSKAKRIHAQLREICAILCGLVVASDYSAGQALIKTHDFCDFAAFFQEIFEVGRRYKIMNPGQPSLFSLSLCLFLFLFFSFLSSLLLTSKNKQNTHIKQRE